MRKVLLVVALAVCCTVLAWGAKAPAQANPELKGGYRLHEKNGWTFVHLEGTPHQIGYQHGSLLAPEIADALRVLRFEAEHDNKKPWQFFREKAETMMWPRIDAEYRDEMQGIADGASAAGVKIDLWDVVAMNAALEWGYFVKEYDRAHGAAPASKAVPEHCSAFVATGSYTKDHKIVIAHNNWSLYPDGALWTVMFDIKPARGNRMLMDGLPGLIHSADDFVVTSAGLAITETTIGHFSGYDEKGIPEFARARKAAQYAANIDNFARIMREGNNGGYANTWLVGDTKANEIARLELGLKNVTLERTKDGVFVGANFPINEKLIHEETNYNPADLSQSAAARRVRWEQIMAKEKGKIDVAAAHRFLADHYDTFEQKEIPSERTLDGHAELSPRGMGDWVGPYGTAGAVQNKAADAKMISAMSLTAAAGHACGMDFRAASHLQEHPEQGWEKDILIDMKAYPWTKFQIAK